ncbi:MAG: TIGR00730 family Rossman fold protein, partial [Planctomycetota bacterium]
SNWTAMSKAHEEPLPPEPTIDAILRSGSYRKARLDTEFLARADLRGLRLQLEYVKVAKLLREQRIHSTIVVFGGTQILDHDRALERLDQAREVLEKAPESHKVAREAAVASRILAKSHYYDAAREFAREVSTAAQGEDRCDYVIVTGGGPGIMEAANRGAYEVGAKSIGFNITLPEEQLPNAYITPELCFQFHYFALRKMHFLVRAKALIAFPGGFGTLDEFFDALCLRQVHKMQDIPILLFGKEYWQKVIDFQFLADEGVIKDSDVELFGYVETATEAWEKIRTFHTAHGTL